MFNTLCRTQKTLGTNCKLKIFRKLMKEALSVNYKATDKIIADMGQFTIEKEKIYMSICVSTENDLSIRLRKTYWKFDKESIMKTKWG